MFATIRRHQSWLLTVVVAVTIVSFIVWGWGKNAGNPGRNAVKGEYGSIGGHAISRMELTNAMRTVQLDYFFNRGVMLDLQSAEVDRSVSYQAFIHLFIEAKMKELGVVVTSRATADYYRNSFLPRFVNSQIPLNQLLESSQFRQNGITLDDFDRWMQFCVGRDQLMTVAGIHGWLVTPQEADAEYRTENRELQTSMVFYSASNFLSSVPANPAEAALYYTNHQSAYVVPEKVSIEYVKFNITNYLAGAEKAMTNLETMVDDNVKAAGTNLFKGTKTSEESRLAIRNELIRRQALGDSRKAAYKFVNDVDAMLPKSADNLRTQAQKVGLAVVAPAPFDRENGPQDSITPMQLGRTAFTCSPDEPFGAPVTTEDGSYVLAQRQLVPTFLPGYETIKAKVADDYRHFQALILAQQASVKLYSSFMTNALPAGKTFASVCADAKVTLESLPPFSQATRNLAEKYESQVDLGTLQRIAFNTPVGSPSQPAPGHDGAFILFIDKALPFNEVKVQSELPEFTLRMRQARQSSAFNEWMTHQIRRDPDFATLLSLKQQELQPRSVRPAKS